MVDGQRQNTPTALYARRRRLKECVQFGHLSVGVTYKQVLLLVMLSTGILVTSGCSLLFGLGGPEPEPTAAVEREVVPTFTPTTPGEQPVQPPLNEVVPINPDAGDALPTATPIAVAAEEQPVVEEQPAAEEPAEAEPAPTEEPESESPTPTPAPQLVVQIEAANVRNGPGTEYGLAGSVTRDQAFDIVGKNPEGTWWLFCCVNGQEVWIFGELVRTENAGDVPVAENIPAPPLVAVAPAAPAEPQNTAPEPQAQEPQPQEQQPAPAADPCAGIGGDGCKFKVREGPQFAPNGGQEIKLQLLFIHSGVDGGQPQSSYFVVMLKDGHKLPIGDNIRSFGPDTAEGPMGRYNYEYKIGLGDIPGNTVAGNYTMFVLDGNGERDSQDFNFTIPEGQGDVWIVWDQG